MNDDKTPVLPANLELWQATLGWHPEELQQAQFQRLYELVLEGNRQFNLTRITAPEEFWEKHLWDSLSGVTPLLKDEKEIKDEKEDETEAFSSLTLHASPLKAVDIGTGAGFPGIPLAIACPDWKIALLDSTRKKTAFLETLLQSLELEHAYPLTDRVELVGQNPQHRAQYDLALLRAVAAAPVCAEYALPLLKIGGMAVLYRGLWSAEEAEALQVAADQLGGAIAEIRAFSTPVTQGVRHCVYLKKVAATPAEFPRPVGIAVQRSL